ncbi:hypothetical protein K1T71_014866 [Dendrolimus kikuchii]|nr:hypothetical protein K1T71_014866 [Dendrolimus kikuchii]
MKMHFKHKNYFCQLCDAIILGDVDDYKDHLFTHKIKREQFKCGLCPKKYIRYDLYKRHLEEHEGVKNKKYLICNECGKKYTDKRNLINHLASHKLCLPLRFMCTACGSNYCEERLLKTHIRKYHFNLQNKAPNFFEKKINETDRELKNYDTKRCIEEDGYFECVSTDENDKLLKKVKCEYCNKEMLKKSLPLHIRERHLNVQKFVCETCKRGFNRHYQFLEHVCFVYRFRRRYRMK